MMKPKANPRAPRGIFAAVVLLGLVGTTFAQSYDFNRIVPGGGGGGGTDPEKRKIVAARGQYICLDVKQGSSNQVMFTIWSMVPEPNASLQRISFDTGTRQPDLISNITVITQSPGLKPVVNTSRGSGRRFEVYLPYEYSKQQGGGKQPTGGLKRGNFIVVSATLGPGRTVAHLMSALQEGLNPATEKNGLYITAGGHSFLGGPPLGVATISDDATFALRGPSPQCRR
jgi:hypothetical protein